MVEHQSCCQSSDIKCFPVRTVFDGDSRDVEEEDTAYSGLTGNNVSENRSREPRPSPHFFWSRAWHKRCSIKFSTLSQKFILGTSSEKSCSQENVRISVSPAFSNLLPTELFFRHRSHQSPEEPGNSVPHLIKESYIQPYLLCFLTLTSLGTPEKTGFDK